MVRWLPYGTGCPGRFGWRSSDFSDNTYTCRKLRLDGTYQHHAARRVYHLTLATSTTALARSRCDQGSPRAETISGDSGGPDSRQERAFSSTLLVHRVLMVGRHFHSSFHVFQDFSSIRIYSHLFSQRSGFSYLIPLSHSSPSSLTHIRPSQPPSSSTPPPNANTPPDFSL